MRRVGETEWKEQTEGREFGFDYEMCSSYTVVTVIMREVRSPERCEMLVIFQWKHLKRTESIAE
jgi:hypothetical protein